MIFAILGQFGEPWALYAQACREHYQVCGKWIRGWSDIAPAPDTYFAWSHEPMHVVTVPKDTFTITILRDPVRRIMSQYRMMLIYDAQGRRQMIPDHEWEWMGNDILDFARKMPKTHLLRQLYMFSSEYNVNEACGRIESLSHYFKLHKYASGLSGLADKLDIELLVHKVGELRCPQHPVGRSVEARIQRELTDGILTRLIKILEPEYELLRALRYGRSTNTTV